MVYNIADYEHGRPLRSQLQLRSHRFFAELGRLDLPPPLHTYVPPRRPSGGTPAAARAA